LPAVQRNNSNRFNNVAGESIDIEENEVPEELDYQEDPEEDSDEADLEFAQSMPAQYPSQVLAAQQQQQQLHKQQLLAQSINLNMFSKNRGSTTSSHVTSEDQRRGLPAQFTQ
jgi:hypothetical protein